MSLNFTITGNTEVLQIADAVAREKSIPRESVIEAMEQALQIAGRRKYGHEQNIRVAIDKKSGAISMFRDREVVETVENAGTQISLKDAKKIDPSKNLTDVISEPLPPIEFGRVTAQTAKQVIVQKVRDAERERQFEDFKDRVGEVVSGVVKRVEYGNVTVDFGRAEAVLRREEIIPRENFRQNDRVRALILDVRREKKGPQIFLSRTHPQFLAKLFAQEVPEIYDGIITIEAAVRDPGSRAKIAVSSRDSNIDPVGSCVGMRGSRVQAVVAELQGEKIDIIQYTPDLATFVVAALSPSPMAAEVSKLVIDEDNHRIEVVVPEDQLSLVIGRRGQNVRLASQLVGWNIDVLTEEEESKRRTEEFNTLSKLFTEALNVEEIIAHLLVTEGFRSIDEIAFVPKEDLAGIEGFDEGLAEELQGRAKTYLDEREAALTKQWRDLGVKEDLATMEGFTPAILVALGKASVKTRDDFAELSRDDFVDLVPDHGKTDDEINAMIMAARAHWFEGDKASNA